jgi:subfamily B ATP-binding cassette protein MsbA
MHDLRSLLKYCKPYIPNIFLNIFFNLGSTVFSIFSFLMLIPFLNLIFNAEKLISAPIKEMAFNVSNIKEFIATHFNNKVISFIQGSETMEVGKTKALLFICLFTVVVFFIKNIFRYLAVHVLASYAHRYCQ